MRTLCLSGWGQPADALASIAPDATHLGYTHHDNVADVLSAIAKEAARYDRIIGWSLGGQLAVRAVKFKKERGRLPSIDAQDPWERRMAEGAAAFVRFKDEGRYE